MEKIFSVLFGLVVSVSAAPAASAFDADFDAATALREFAEGATPTWRSARGDWRLVGSAKLIAETLDGAEYAYAPDGVRNQDGSLFNVLAIRRAARDFYGNRALSVRVLNLGDRESDQGPYSVEFENTVGDDGRHLAIRQNLYADARHKGTYPSRAWLDQRCRQLHARNDRMICIAVYRDEGTADRVLKAYDGQPIFVRGFAKD